jgi:GTPase
MRHAARTDAVQKEIIKALRAIGARVVYIKEPVDLLVGFRGATHLMEVKESGGRLTKQQEDFLTTWNGGSAWIVQTPSQAIEAVIGKEAMR